MKNFTFFYYVLYSPPDVSSTSVNYPQLTFSDVKALAEELDNLEINIGNICVGHIDSECVTLVVEKIEAQVGNGNTQHSAIGLELPCPSVDVNTWSRQNAEETWNVASWSDCSDLCRQRQGCTAWTWHHENAGLARPVMTP